MTLKVTWADVNARDNYGRAALHAAAFSDADVEILEYLVSLGTAYTCGSFKQHRS